jgi:hypothetical protein
VSRLAATADEAAAFQVFQLIHTVDAPHTMRAWFMGMNPQQRISLRPRRWPTGFQLFSSEHLTKIAFLANDDRNAAEQGMVIIIGKRVGSSRRRHVLVN